MTISRTNSGIATLVAVAKKTRGCRRTSRYPVSANRKLDSQTITHRQTDYKTKKQSKNLLNQPNLDVLCSRDINHSKKKNKKQKEKKRKKKQQSKCVCSTLKGLSYGVDISLYSKLLSCYGLLKFVNLLNRPCSMFRRNFRRNY